MDVFCHTMSINNRKQAYNAVQAYTEYKAVLKNDEMAEPNALNMPKIVTSSNGIPFVIGLNFFFGSSLQMNLSVMQIARSAHLA